MLKNAEISFTSEEYNTSNLDNGNEEIIKNRNILTTSTTTKTQKNNYDNNINNLTSIYMGDCETLKIKTLCVNEDGKILQKNVLFKLKQNQLESSKSAYDKEFLRKTLGEIFSQEISSKYILHPSTHNKNLIESLMDDKNEKNKIYLI